ncbi:MAG: riboflavin biosynthesis protein RibF [Muribaculaceae bacterium]|nr:riboflavin biosynthesis protein RibF [Muribaculaceae bacterium]
MTHQIKTSAVTIGTFDGYHRGHQAVVQTLRAEAAARCLEPIAIGFDRHPLAVVAPERTPRMLCSAERRHRLISGDGVRVMDMEFDRKLAGVRSRDFMRMLRDTLGTCLIIIGYDNTFGCDGVDMNVAQYIDLGAQEGVEVLEAPLIEGISSSAIRKAVAAGDIEKANMMLGRPYGIEGGIVHGRGIGHTLGFPTANLRPGYPAQLPGNGVYVAEALLPGGTRHPAIVNVGVRPTVGNSPEPQIEAHLLDYKGDLYGSEMTLEFLSRLRDEKKFDSRRELTEAIAADMKEARQRFML